jgi:hypothetical protein
MAKMTVQMYGVYSGRPTAVQLFSPLETPADDGWFEGFATLINARADDLRITVRKRIIQLMTAMGERSANESCGKVGLVGSGTSYFGDGH